MATPEDGFTVTNEPVQEGLYTPARRIGTNGSTGRLLLNSLGIYSLCWDSTDDLGIVVRQVLVAGKYFGLYRYENWCAAGEDDYSSEEVTGPGCEEGLVRLLKSTTPWEDILVVSGHSRRTETMVMWTRGDDDPLFEFASDGSVPLTHAGLQGIITTTAAEPWLQANAAQWTGALQPVLDRERALLALTPQPPMPPES